jgi:hypothetical protein
VSESNIVGEFEEHPTTIATHSPGARNARLSKILGFLAVSSSTTSLAKTQSLSVTTLSQSEPTLSLAISLTVLLSQPDHLTASHRGVINTGGIAGSSRASNRFAGSRSVTASDLQRLRGPSIGCGVSHVVATPLTWVARMLERSDGKRKRLVFVRDRQ